MPVEMIGQPIYLFISSNVFAQSMRTFNLIVKGENFTVQWQLCLKDAMHWRIWVGCRDARPSLGSIFIILMQFVKKKLPNYSLVFFKVGVGALLLGNSRWTTALEFEIVHKILVKQPNDYGYDIGHFLLCTCLYTSWT